MKPTKPYVIHRVRKSEPIDATRRSVLQRGHSPVNHYKRILDLFTHAVHPVEMVFEVFDPREGLTLIYANLKYIVDGKKEARTYHLATEVSEEQMMDLQYTIGSPIAFNARQLYVKITEKPSVTSLKMEIRDKNGDYNYTRTVDKKTGKVREKTSVDGYSFQNAASWKRLLTSLQMKQNPKNPFGNKRSGIVGEVIIDNKPQTVELLDLYLTR